jgi:hypothetical protein
VLRRELEVLLQLVDDGPAAGVDTEVLEGLLEVGDIRPPFVAKHFSANEGEEEKDLLRSRKNKRPMVVMFDFKASPTMAMRSFCKEIPTLPSLSSSSS